jgi:anti-sigma factor RsiW
MECGHFDLLMQRYYDGELGPAERAEYENHRRQCVACRELDGSFALLVAALNDAPLFEPSPGFSARVLSQVNIAAYRTSPARKALVALGRLWGGMPVAVRNSAVIAFIGVVFIAVYKPLLDSMVSTIGRGAIALWSAIVIVQELVKKMGFVVRGTGTAQNYEVVGRTLVRAFRHAAAGMNLVQVTLVVTALIFVGIVIFRMVGSARRKGESNGSIL